MATKDFSSKQENMIADFLGWSVVTGSGAAACFPGDVIGDDWLGECKTHVERGHNIFFNHDVWKKIKDEAAVKRRFPVLFTDDGSQKSNHTWCLFRSNCLDDSQVSVYRADEFCNKNITFSHSIVADLYGRYMRESQDSEKYPVLAVSWKGEEVAITSLDIFREMYA